MSRFIIITLIVITILILGFYLYSRLVFTGAFDKKYTREELIQNFIQHENDFADLIVFFKSKVPQNKDEIISFGLSKGERVSLIINPSIIDSTSKAIGGDNLELGSAKLDSVISIIGWTNETIRALKDKLSKTNCDRIRSTKIYGGNPIEMYPNQSGWSSYSYHIFDMPVSDSLIQIHGKPIGSSSFGKSVVLDYTSAP